MNTVQHAVGAVVVSGNTHNPRRSHVLALDVPWSALTAKEQKDLRAICDADENATYVRFATRTYRGVLSTRTFAHTHYASNAAMIKAFTHTSST